MNEMTEPEVWGGYNYREVLASITLHYTDFTHPTRASASGH